MGDHGSDLGGDLLLCASPPCLRLAPYHHGSSGPQLKAWGVWSKQRSFADLVPRFVTNRFHDGETIFHNGISTLMISQLSGSATLLETGCLPSAKLFVECILSGTRQISYLPSAVTKALGKIIALGKRGKKHSAKFGTRQTRKKTLGKR